MMAAEKRPLDEDRCPFHSRAWGCRCERHLGHEDDCCSAGDGFAGGWDPNKGPPGGPDDLAERQRLEARPSGDPVPNAHRL